MIMKKIGDIKLSNEQINNIDGQVSKDNNYIIYKLTDVALSKMGLSEIDDCKNYVIVYNLEDYTKLDVLYLPGIKNDNVTYYSLSKLK